jgi:anaerobic nitric oxide reductase transcription regulator
MAERRGQVARELQRSAGLSGGGAFLGASPAARRLLDEIQRVGSDRTLRATVRVLAATNRNLEAEVAAGRFRADLYHRLAVYPIRVPPLHDRRPDIPLLAAHFLDLGRQRLGLGPVRLTEEARERLLAAHWPGNVRELENVISRGILRAARRQSERGGPLLIGVEHLDLESSEVPADATDSSSAAPLDRGPTPPSSVTPEPSAAS